MEQFTESLFSQKFIPKIDVNNEAALQLQTPDRPYKCDICYRSYNSKLYLRDHMTIHSDIRAYECKICSKRFRFGSNLSEHKTVHVPNNLFFKCMECNHAARLRGNLKKHMRKHYRDRLSLDEAWREYSTNAPPPNMLIHQPKQELGVSSTFKPSSMMRNCVDNLVDAFVKKVEDCAGLADSVDCFMSALEDLDIDLIDCPFCGRRFSSFFDCTAHISTAQANHNKPVDAEGRSCFCDKCLRCFVDANALETHMSYHRMVGEMTTSGYLDVSSRLREFVISQQQKNAF